MYKYSLLVLAVVALAAAQSQFDQWNPFKGYTGCSGDRGGNFGYISSVRTDSNGTDQTVFYALVGAQYNLQFDWVPGPSYDPNSPISIVVNAVSSNLGIVLTKLLDVGDMCNNIVNNGTCPLAAGFNYTVQIPLIGCFNFFGTPLNFYTQTLTLVQGNPTTSNDNKYCISYPVRCQAGGYFG